jgi:hypothetical protein
MINRVAAFTSVVGFLMVFGGVGGIENEGPLLENTIIAIAGLGVMAVGISLLKSASTKDNPTLW